MAGGPEGGPKKDNPSIHESLRSIICYNLLTDSEFAVEIEECSFMPSFSYKDHQILSDGRRRIESSDLWLVNMDTSRVA